MTFLNDTLMSSLRLSKKEKGTAKKKPQQSEEQIISSTLPIAPPAPVAQQSIIDVVNVPPKKDRVQLPVYLPWDLKNRFQSLCSSQGIKMSALIKTWIIEYIKQADQYEN